jgi:antitoxin (DNA-binding transcriptional repressor) of toxin-antitoxin stability system
MKQVNVADIKNHFSDYLNDVEKGNDVGICRRNILVARLTAAHEKTPAPNKTCLGCGRGTVVSMDDLTEPLIPTTDWNMLGKDTGFGPHT